MDIFEILKEQGKLTNVLIYPAVETIADPFEKNTTKGFLNPITIKALVTQISFEALRWKYYGQIPLESIKIICKLKYENLLKLADKIQIGDKFYKCYQDDSKGFAILKRNDYLIVVLESKND